MEDAFNRESFLLYSPSITQILSQHGVALWFNLIAYNGSCWQSYGPIIHFKGLEPDDIFFFASELNPGIETGEDLNADLEQNLFPYLMLLTAANYPFTSHGEDPILHVIAEHPMDDFDSGQSKKDFTLEYVPGVFRMNHSVWNKPPHFAVAYYDEQKKTMLLTSLTERGFHELVNGLNDYGLNLPKEPDIRVHLSMTLSIKKIFGKEQHLNPYENYSK